MTDNVIRNHLRQKYSVAVFAGEAASRFVCFDVDDGRKETVHGVIDALAALGFPKEHIHVSYSGSKGYHVEMFFCELVQTWRLREVYQKVIASTGFDPRKVEFRPTHGSAIKLPLSIHARTGNICWFVSADSLDPIRRYEYLLEIRQIPASIVDSVVPCASSRAQSPAEKQSWEEARLEQTGARHDLMRNIAVYMRQTGQSRELIEKALLSWYERQDAALIKSTRQEVLRDIDALLEWVFSERFVLLPCSGSKPIRVSAADMRMVMSVQNPSARRILFLLLARDIAERKAITTAEIARTVGVSQTTAAKGITYLKEEHLVKSEPGSRLKRSSGNFFCEATRYSVSWHTRDAGDAGIEFSLEDVMKCFDDCYQHALALAGQSLRDPFRASSRPAEPILRIDQCGRKQEYRSEKFGSITAYVVNDRVLYPLTEVARLIRKSDPYALAKQCPAKEKWRIHTGRQVVCKNYIERGKLKQLLERSRSRNRQELIDWLCK